MCNGHRNPSPSPPPPPPAAALLLDLAASDDLQAFKAAVEIDGVPLTAAAPWYGAAFGPARTMASQDRTPAMVAALYGSAAVLDYILSAAPAEARRRSATDGATALHCAAAGGAASAAAVAALLVSVAPDAAETLDAAGRRPADVIARRSTQTLEQILSKASPFSSPSSSPPISRVSSPVKGEKREFWMDSTLPDIKDGIFGTDEFRMYQFKVRPCSRAYSHDWTECPFVHPGENARRRDPKKFTYSCVPCPEFKKAGACRNGDACEYAHGVFESWLHPAQYKTRLCKDEIGCNRRVCFFAHKPEEIRQVNPSAVSIGGGMVLSSPKASALSSLEMATTLMLMQQQQQQPGSPSLQSQSRVSQNTPPSLQSQSSRLRSSLSSRDLDFDPELFGLDSYQNKLIDEISANSPRLGRSSSSLNSAALRTSEYPNLLGSVDPALLSQLQGRSVKQQSGIQYQLPAGSQFSQSQLLSIYGNSSSSSHPVSAAMSSHPVSAAMSSPFAVDHSTAKAIMNSRASAFAKRSQSFIDRGTAAGRQSTLSAMTTAAVATAAESSVLTDWGSPDGKLDWGVQGEELNKLRKSATFNFRNKQAPKTVASASSPPGFDEPDLSWVHSLVKEAPQGQGQGQLGYQIDGISELYSREKMPLWSEHGKIMA